MYEIAVVGCGVIGLTSSLAIQKEFKDTCRVTIFTDKLTPNTTGDVAAGLWCPFMCQETDIKNIVKWSKVTYDYLLHLWKEGFGEEAGICLHVATIASEHAIERPEWLSIPISAQELTAKHLEKLNKTSSKRYKDGVNFITLSAKPSRLLPFMQKKFVENKGELVIKTITNLNQLSKYCIIINCTGLYSRTLMNDNQLIPSRGQLIRVLAPWNFETFIDIDTDADILLNIDSVLLGGTSEMNSYNLNVSSKDTELIKEKCGQIVPALLNAPIMDIKVGLRPVRSRVKLDFEIMKVGNKFIPVIHNYGHGGSGITLSFGCALDVVQLVKSALKNNFQHKL